MKITLSSKQLLMVLKTETVKLPINFDLSKISKKEAHEIIKVLIGKKSD